MKRLFILVTVFLSFYALSAQEVSEKDLEKHAKAIEKSAKKHNGTESLDTFFYDGKPVSLFIVTKRFLGNNVNFEFRSFKEGKTLIIGELITIGTGAEAKYYNDLAFIEHNHKLRLSNFEKYLDLLGQYNVINDSAVDIENLNKLLLMKGAPTVQTNAAANSQQNFDTKKATRNSNGMVMVIGENIKQGGSNIGTVKTESRATEGTIVYTITVRFTDGTICATATANGIGNYNYLITTAKDNKQRSISSSIGQGEKDVSKWLVDNLYL